MPIMPISRTPDSISLQARRQKFDIDAALATDWHGGDAFKTAFFNSLSMTFPIGEKFFIDSVRACMKDVTDEKLVRDVEGFIAQEAMHSMEHRRYNQRLCELRGYDHDYIIASQKRRLEWAEKNLSAKMLLAATMGYEHLTALFAHGSLTDDNWFGGADPAMAELWRWHAREELEHKSVAYDVYRAVGGDHKKQGKVLRGVTITLIMEVLRGMRHMLKDYQGSKVKLWWHGMGWLFGKQGILRPLWPEYRAYLKPGFHPWNHDNRDLLDMFEDLDGPADPVKAA